MRIFSWFEIRVELCYFSYVYLSRIEGHALLGAGFKGFSSCNDMISILLLLLKTGGSCLKFALKINVIVSNTFECASVVELCKALSNTMAVYSI